jgi:hypothetical protein
VNSVSPHPDEIKKKGRGNLNRAARVKGNGKYGKEESETIKETKLGYIQ